jgi:glycosyltransferase involved in cell wall biosynthesis
LKKKKILIVVDSLGVGGTQEQIYCFVKYLKEYEFTILSFFSDDFYYERICREGAKVIFLSKTKNNILKKLISIPVILYKFQRKKKWIKCHDWINIRLPFSLLVSSFFKLYKLDYVSFSVECSYGQLNFYEKLIFNINLKKYKVVFFGLPGRLSFKNHKIPQNSIYDDIPFTTLRNQSKKPIQYKNKINILFVSRLIPIKGLEDTVLLIEYYNNLYDEKINLHIIGDGPELLRIKKICNLRNLKFIHFYGFISNLEDYYYNATALIKTSFYEPANSVVREFLTNGKLVFSTIEGPTDEELEKNGLIVGIKRHNYQFSAKIINQTLSKFPARYNDDIKSKFNKEFGNDFVRKQYINVIEANCKNLK